ncbi:hypothetical protein [Niallia nealsonii]|uniref:Lipoprotein n=1 Tax=Niallia nealsonii TaxID=115979 RepID=A0A2N0YWB7_9BACI|nr:hypothetical protein [Niallia nealsonii]PKG21549.1 hypothetical protein CWS01_21870 [Niallia nealsonii]
MKKQLYLICMFSLIVLFLAGCKKNNEPSVKDGNVEPKITINYSTQSLTKEDLINYNSNLLASSNVEDFKKFSLTINFQGTGNMKNPDISIPLLNKIINSLDKKRYIGGNASTLNEENKTVAEVVQVIYTKDLPVEKLKKKLKENPVIINWETKDGEKKEKKYNLSEYLKYNN